MIFGKISQRCVFWPNFPRFLHLFAAFSLISGQNSQLCTFWPTFPPFSRIFAGFSVIVGQNSQVLEIAEEGGGMHTVVQIGGGFHYALPDNSLPVVVVGNR